MQRTERRAVIFTAFLAVVCFSAAEAVPPAIDVSESPYAEAVHRLSPRVLVVTARNPGHNNVTAIAGEKGVVVVDTATSPVLAPDRGLVIEALFQTHLTVTITDRTPYIKVARRS